MKLCWGVVLARARAPKSLGGASHAKPRALLKKLLRDLRAAFRKGGGDGWKAMKSRVFGAGGWIGVAG